MKLTPRQERFCNEYIIDFNARQAALRAGYSTATANSKAWGILAQPACAHYIDELKLQLRQKNEAAAQRVINELALIAFADLTDYLSIEHELSTDLFGVTHKAIVSVKSTAGLHPLARRAIAEIKQTPQGVTIKLHDKVAALEKLSRHLGVFDKAADPGHVTISVSYKEPPATEE
jgi:phage terminase small subunit